MTRRRSVRQPLWTCSACGCNASLILPSSSLGLTFSLTRTPITSLSSRSSTTVSRYAFFSSLLWMVSNDGIECAGSLGGDTKFRVEHDVWKSTVVEYILSVSWYWLLHFHFRFALLIVIINISDIKGPSSYTGIWNMRILAWLARDRTKQLINLTLDQFEIEKKLYIRIFIIAILLLLFTLMNKGMVALMKDLLYDFNKKAKNYLREHGLELPLRLWY